MTDRKLTVLRGPARAKVTLSLRVLGTRPDGFHELDALTVTASDPHDDVTVMPQVRSGTTCIVTPRSGAPTRRGENLAERAVELLRPHLPASVDGIRIKLTKRIPMGAGLGGGSSDAATVLALLGKHFRVSDRTVHRVAAKLGSDVPFCVRGTPAFMRGRGERLDPARNVPRMRLVVVTPPFGCPTPAVYRAWDELGGPTSDRVIDSDLVVGGLRNDLEPAALVVRPALGDLRDTIARCTDRTPLLLGSGSSYCVIVDDDDEAERHFVRLTLELGLDSIWCATTNGS
jgi:4-diphosphocytidyl-2-C-methyl-D-erythritol kinase